jgi:hypothetical protein
MHISPTNAHLFIRSIWRRASSEGWSGCGPESVRIWRRSAEARQTEIDALLPSPAAIGIVERSVYKHPGKDCDPRDNRRYKKHEAEFW